MTDAAEWKNRQLVTDLVAATDDHTEDDELRTETGLEHVFRVLGLVLPAEPLRIALRAVQTDDPSLRGTALEYLESILPADVRAQLWPLLETEDKGAAAAVSGSIPEVEPSLADSSPGLPGARKPRSQDEILAELSMSYPSIVAKLKQRGKPSKPG